MRGLGLILQLVVMVCFLKVTQGPQSNKLTKPHEETRFNCININNHSFVRCQKVEKQYMNLEMLKQQNRWEEMVHDIFCGQMQRYVW